MLQFRTVGLAMGWTTFFFLGTQTPIMAIAFEDIRIGFPAMATVVGSVIEPLYAFVKTVSAQTWVIHRGCCLFRFV